MFGPTRAYPQLLDRLPLMAGVLTLALAAGCATHSQQERVMTVTAADYPAAFDAALAVADSHGLKPVVMDRSTGIIETGARGTGSLLQPWRQDNNGLADGLAQTINFQRRRMRVEFVPVGLSLPAPDIDGAIQPAAIPGSTRAEQRFDLTTNKGPVEMRAWVFLEREFRPNQRIGNWTLVQTRYSRDPLEAPNPADQTTSMPGTWTPIGRDEAYERMVMAEIHERILPPSVAGTAPAP